MGGDHTAEVVARLLLAAANAGANQPGPPRGETVDFSLWSVVGALVLACFAAIPIGISLWALLDAARRPRWAWALSGRRQIVWMAMIMFGALSLVGGLVISGWYLVKIRPRLARVEGGDV